MKKFALFLFLLLGTTIAFAQDKPQAPENEQDQFVGKDKRISTPFCTFVAGYTIPKGEMGRRYNSFITLNANLGWKTQENWMYMIEFGFGFASDNVKIKDQILSGLMVDRNTNEPFIVSKEGSDAGVVAYNRNLSFVGKFGKVLSLSQKRPNSGILLLLGGGFLQHQIVYQSTLEVAQQLEGDYAYGYDRQMRGGMLSAFVGYLNMSKNTFTNFYIGIEFNQAWTKMTRKYQFDLHSGDNKIYQDRMWTFKLGWMFPFYGRESDKVYYF